MEKDIQSSALYDGKLGSFTGSESSSNMIIVASIAAASALALGAALYLKKRRQE